jgi:hypothetical protein
MAANKIQTPRVYISDSNFTGRNKQHLNHNQ